MRSKLVLGIADGWLEADGSVIYRALDLKVGLFKDAEAPQPASLIRQACGIASTGPNVAQSNDCWGLWGF